MRPLPVVQARVPSKSLLRFLRSQSEAQCFFTANPAVSFVHPRRPDSASTSISARGQSDRRHLTSTAQSEAGIRPSYIDELWPRHSAAAVKALPPPRRYHQYNKWKTSTRVTSGSRNASRDSSRAQLGFLKRLWHLSRQPVPTVKDPTCDDLPPSGSSYDDPSVQLFNLSRALSRNPAGADLKLRCTEFDANGSVTLVSGEFKKSELIAKYGLLPRDLRKIDSSVLPHILVRPSAILINLLHLRVLIQSDRVLVFDAFGSTDSYTQSLFMYDLEGKLRQKADARSTSNGSYLPYEFRALEAVLISVTQGLESEFEGVREPVVRVLRALEEDIDRDKLRHLLIHSKKLGTFEQKARLVRDAINDLLEADDDLAAMYLTDKKKGHMREQNNHQEVEMLLEAYHKVCDEIVEVSGNLISNIRNTEEVVRAILDANRNSLMLLEIKFSVGTLGLATGTLIAGLYGMNLNNFIEETDWGFAGISTVCFGLTAIVCVYGLQRLRKLQRVRMWGEGYGHSYGSSRGNWRTEAIEHSALLGKSRKDMAKKLKEAKGPVLWPGMDGLGVNNAPTVTIHDDVSTAPAREAGQVRVPVQPPMPATPSANSPRK